jgi:hypothetical protein
LAGKYKIWVKNSDGNTLHVIESPWERVQLRRGDKNKLLAYLVGKDQFKWAFDVFPNELNAIYKL